MKTLASLISGISLFVSLTSSTPVGDKEIVKGSEVQIKVVMCYEGCDEEPAIYQVNGNSLTKIADLEKLDKSNPSTHSNNARTLSNVLADVDLNAYYIKSMESIKRDDCGFDMFYVLSKK